MPNRYLDFIRVNAEQWSRLPASKDSRGLLLVEPQSHPLISHANAIFACIVKAARGFNIGWIDTGDKDIQERLLSYDPASRIIPQIALTRSEKLGAGRKFFYSALRMLLRRDLLGFSLHGIPFGDILYDSYLARYKMATIRRVNRGVLRTLLDLIISHYRYRKLLINTGASALLTSHQVGLSSGLLLRTGLGLGLEVYMRSGGARSNVQCNRWSSLDEIYNYQRKPRPPDIEFLRTINPQFILSDFDELIDERIRGERDLDSNLAYHVDKTTYISRQEFADTFSIDVNKRNVFVMLHAFNDHPHSHFKGMLFRDYYDWFLQTLKFAWNKTDVNWIFKEHPSSKYYPTCDISLPDHFKDCPEHIVFLDERASFNSRSLFYLADTVITCLGSVGVELPAARGIPSIIAGDTFYNGFGFTIEPKCKDEYFQILRNVETIKKLTEEQQYIGKLVFLYIQRYCEVPFDWCPTVTYEHERDPKLDTYYWDLVLDQYRQRSDAMLRQFIEYVRCVGQRDFVRLVDFSALGRSLRGAERFRLKEVEAMTGRLESRLIGLRPTTINGEISGL